MHHAAMSVRVGTRSAERGVAGLLTSMPDRSLPGRVCLHWTQCKGCDAKIAVHPRLILCLLEILKSARARNWFGGS
jgi:hypothetical protein